MPSRHVFERGILKNRIVVSIAFTKLIVIIYLGITDFLIFLLSLSIIQTICLSSCEIMKLRLRHDSKMEKRKEYY